MIRGLLSDFDWNRLSKHLPAERGYQGRPAKDNRNMIDGILWIHRTGSPWRDLPSDFGPWQSVYTRFSRWSQRGIWKDILDILSTDRDDEGYQIDSSIVRAHQHSAGGKGGLRTKP